MIQMSKIIVIIDDEQDLCDLYHMLFKSLDVCLHTFTKAKDGVDFILENKVDVCLIDYRMPGLSGIETRSLLPEDLLCYLVTGELNVDLPENFAGILDKPFDKDQLISILNL